MNNNLIYLDGEISHSTMVAVTSRIIEIRDEQGPKAPITILIQSDGGDVRSAIAIAGVIRHFNPVTAIAIGDVISAAGRVFLACEKRYALPSACLGIHQSSWTERWLTSNKTLELHSQLKRYDMLLAVTLSRITGMDESHWLQKMKETEDISWLNHQQMLDLNIIAEPENGVYPFFAKP